MTVRAVFAAAVLALAAFAAPAAEIAVAPGGDALARALASAGAGDRLVLRPGVHRGGVVADRTLEIVGQPGAVLEGPGVGSVLTVDAPGVRVEGLRIVGSGSSHETIDSGVKLTKAARGARVLNNVLEGNLYGVDVHGARDALVSGNRIVGRSDRRMNDRGNGVYVWNAPGAIIENNDIRRGRDGIFVNTSRRNVFRGNRFENLRFAVHFMYSNGSEVSGNVSIGNHLGYAVMYTRDALIADNVSIGDRDHGIMLNYVTKAEIRGNLVRGGGEKCLFMYNANRSRLIGNRFEGCPIGIHFTAGSDDNEVSGNAFVGNRVQVKYVGTRMQEWSRDGRGNYWSDHAAYDVNGDGIADQPYRPNDMMDQILWTQPAAKLLLGAPAIQLVRWAQREFPALLPGGVVDSRPLMAPVHPAAGLVAGLTPRREAGPGAPDAPATDPEEGGS